MSIKTDAVVIRDETTTGANTAVRVGTNLVDIADDLVAKQAAIDLNTAKVGITPTQASDIVTNNAKVGVTTEEANPDVVSQVEAEAGVATTERIWTAQRVKQAIDALAGGGAGVDDTAYGISWDGVTGIAPSKNALYDFIESQVFKVDASSNIIPIFWGGTQAEYDIDFPAGHDPEYFIVITDGAVSPTSASDIVNVPSGNLVADNVQGALDELQTELDANISFDSTSSTRLADTSGTNTGDQVIPVTGVDFDPVGTDNSTDVTLTTTGTSGAATLVGQVLNIPDYATGGGTPSTITELGETLHTQEIRWSKHYIKPRYGVNSYDGGELGTNFSYSGGNANYSGALRLTFKTGATAGTLAWQRGIPDYIDITQDFYFGRSFKIQSNVTDSRVFVGLSKAYTSSNPTNVDMTTLLNTVGVCKIATSDNLHILFNGSSGTGTLIDLGINYPATNVTEYRYTVELYSNLTDGFSIKVTREDAAGTKISISQTGITNINTVDGSHAPVLFIGNNASAADAIIDDFGAVWLRKEF